MEKLQKIFRRLTFFEVGIISVLFVLMILSIFFQVVNRNFIKISINWTEELARYCMIYIAMLGSEIGLRDGSQMSVEMFSKWLPARMQGFIDIIATVINVFFCAVASYSSLLIIETNFQMGQTSPNMHLPMWIPYLSVTIALAIMAMAQLYKLGTQIYYMKKSDGMSSKALMDEEG